MIFNIPVLGFAARSGTGKTSLLVKLIPLLREGGLRIAVIKHSHHDFEIDYPGKDSYELRMAGAVQMLIASPYREALITEKNGVDEPDLAALVKTLEPENIDLVLVEGFRQWPFPRIELHRSVLNQPYLHRENDGIIAIATDTPLEIEGLAQLDINNPVEIAQYVISWLKLQGGEEGANGT